MNTRLFSVDDIIECTDPGEYGEEKWGGFKKGALYIVAWAEPKRHHIDGEQMILVKGCEHGIYASRFELYLGNSANACMGQ